MMASRVWLGYSILGIERNSASVYGICMLAEEHLGRGPFDDAAGVHHDDFVGPTGDNAEVVGDEHERHVPLSLLGLQQIENLGLHGHIERRGWFVGDEQLRAARERDGDDDALAHTAG